MAFIDNESFDPNLDTITDEQPQEIQETPEQPQEVVVEKVVPDKYKDKSLEDIVKMHQEAEKMIGRQAQEVHEVRSLADQLLKRQLESDKVQTVESAPEVDFFENPQDSIKRAIENNPAVIEAKQANLEFKRMKTAQQLASKHPDFGTIANDTGFQEWVKASPIRLSLYAKADAEFDFSSADELLSTYKELKQVRNNNVQETGKKQQAQALKAAGVDTGGSGEVAKKVYRRADLIRLKMTDPDRYEQLQPEIMAAYAQGRVK
jgi:hypothetical protein